MITASAKQLPKTPLSIEKKHKLDKHVCDMGDIKENKDLDLIGHVWKYKRYKGKARCILLH